MSRLSRGAVLGAAAAAALLYFLAVDRGPRPEEFPVGFIGAQSPADARALAEQGFAAVPSCAADEGEIRFRSYDAVLGGARGVRYLACAPAPEIPADVAGPARELRALAPVFARGRSIAPPFAAAPGGPAARAWTYRGRDYVVLAARRAGTDVLFPPELLAPEWRPLFENRRDPRELLRRFGASWYLRAHRVLVLESRLRPGRLLGR